jgi:hypothetical protein
VSQQLEPLHYCPLCEKDRRKVFYRVEVDFGDGWEILLGDMCQRGFEAACARKEELEQVYGCPVRIISVTEVVIVS